MENRFNKVLEGPISNQCANKVRESQKVEVVKIHTVEDERGLQC